jgi:hypothetical protein
VEPEVRRPDIAVDGLAGRCARRQAKAACSDVDGTAFSGPSIVSPARLTGV